MPIEIRCDGCGQRYSAPDPWRGQTKNCPKCGATIKVPDDEGESAELGLLEEEDAETEAPPDEPPPELGADLGPLDDLDDLGVEADLCDPLASLDADAAAAGSSLLRPPPKPSVDWRSYLKKVPCYLKKVPWRIVIPAGVVAGVLLMIVIAVSYIVGTVRSIAGPSSVVGAEPLVWNVQITPVTPRQMTVADYAIDASSASIWLPPRHRRFCVLTLRQRSGDTHQVWNLATGKLVKTLDDSPQTQGFLNIDPEGRFLAAYGSQDGKSEAVVIPLVDGYTLIRFDGESHHNSVIEFLPDDRVVAAIPIVTQEMAVITCDLRTGAKLRHFRTREADPDRTDFSPDGRYLAVVQDARVVVIDLEEEETVGELDIPASNSFLPVRVRCEQLRFSHDGRQLAAMCEDMGKCRVVCWDTATGTGRHDYMVPRWYEAAGNDGFEWMPDDSGWLCFGRQVVSRDNGLTLWGGTFPSHGGETLGPLNDQWMLVHWERGREVVEPVPVPRREITARLQALQNDGSAWVKPGQGVSLSIKIGSLRSGSKGDAERFLRDALTERLDELGLQVERGQPAVLEVAYSETKGETLGEVDNSGQPFAMPVPMPNDQFTGKTITGTKALLTLRWTIPGQTGPVWQASLEIDPSWITVARVTDEAVVEETRESVEHRLSKLDIPYFIPKSSGKPAMLPYITAFERRHNAPTETQAPPPATAPPSGTTGLAGGTSPPPPENATTPPAGPSHTPPPGSTSHMPRPTLPVRDREPLAEQPQLTAWTAAADPPRLPQEFRRGKIEVGLPSFGDFKYSVIPSTLLLVHSKDRGHEGVGIFDLSTGKQTAMIDGEFDLRKPYDFSPTGLYLAAPESSASEKINVWSFETGQLLQQIDLGEGPRLETMHFVSPRHLLLVRSDYDEAELILWNVEEGIRQRCIGIAGADSRQRYWRGSLASTPGGKYVLLMLGELLLAYDLTSGECVGQAALPEEISACHGVSFSPDGSQVAALVRASTETKLWCWDMADGDLLAENSCDQEAVRLVGSYRGPAVEWLPDGSGWLLGGHVLVDRESGQPVWELPETTRDLRKMLANDRLLVMMKSGRGRGIADARLPAKDIEKAVATVRAGGDMVDSLLPELTTADWFGATPVGLPNGVVSWRVSPEPKPLSATSVGRPISIGGEYHDIKSVRFAGVGSTKVVVHKEIRPPSKAGRKIPPKCVIERYDIATAAKGNELPLPPLYRLLDVSPSGNRALVGLYLNRRQERIDVLSMSPKKHIAGWRPYAEQKETSIEQAVFVDDETVLTVNGAGTLVAWKMPDCKAAYKIEEFGRILALGPHRKHLFGEQETVFRIFDAATGECHGELESPKLGTTASLGAFHPDGERLAGLVRDRYGQAVVVWNLTDGKIRGEFAIPTDTGSADTRWAPGNTRAMDWRGSDHLLLSGRYLIDVGRKAVVWRYHPSGIQAVNTPDGRHWCSGTRRLRDKNTEFLAAMPMPSPVVAQKAVGLNVEDQIVLAPGDQVALTVSVGSVPGYPDLRQTVLDNLTTSLQLRGIQVDDSAPLRLKLTTGYGTTGERLAVTDGFGRSSPSRQTFSQQKLVCTLTLTDRNGKVAWQRDRNITMRSFGMIEEPDARRQLQTEMQQSFGEFVSGDVAGAVGLPMYVFRPLDEIIAGETTISIEGETAAPKKPAGR